MKRNAPAHPKVDTLRSMLGLRKFQAVGILELLWHFTAQYAPRGDIGKHSDMHIAAFLDWPQKKAAELISALIECGWLEKNTEFRLIVHDWHHHSDDVCDKYLARCQLTYVSGHPPRRTDDRTKTPNGGHDRPKTDKGGQVATLPPTRARGSEPEGESEPEAEVVTARAAFEALKTRPELSWLTDAQWVQVRRNVSGHPKFKSLDWPAWTEWAIGEAIIDPKASERGAKWLQWKLEDWLEGRTQKKQVATEDKTIAIGGFGP